MPQIQQLDPHVADLIATRSEVNTTELQTQFRN